MKNRTKKDNAATTIETKQPPDIFTIPGKCVPAVRMTQRSKFADPQAQKYLEYKDTLGKYALDAKVKLRLGDVAITIRAYYNDKRKRDCDNILKSVCDSLNGIAYKDDSQVVVAWVSKLKDEHERVEVEVSDF